jgi:hypothetical protein
MHRFSPVEEIGRMVRLELGMKVAAVSVGAVVESRGHEVLDVE